MPHRRSLEAALRRRTKANERAGFVIKPTQFFDLPHKQKKFSVFSAKNHLDTQFKDAFKRQHPKCGICGWNESLEALVIHHKNKNHSDNRVENLAVLCRKCHHLLHQELISLGT